MTDYNDGQWHRWSGEDMKPASLHDNSEIEYVWLAPSGRSGTEKRKVGIDALDERPAWGQILAFRVVKEHREPREWWVWENSEGDLYSSSEGTPRAFKVREVIE